MAFTGTATVKQVSDRIVRITGVSLAATATGDIGLHNATGSAPNVLLPESFLAEHYAYLGSNVPFQDAFDVTVKLAASASIALPLVVVKTGTTTADFRALITNAHASVASPILEIYVKFHE